MGLKPRGKTGRKHRAVADPVALAVGQRVRQLRQEYGVSFDELVGVSGLGRGTVSELERGRLIPTVATLAKVAKAFEGLTIADLVLGDSPREQLFEATAHMSRADVAALLRDAISRAEKAR